MNTLTKFIDLNFLTNTQDDSSQKSSVNSCPESATYEVIENEVLKSSNLKGLSISGSLFSLTTFKDVTFDSCVFFGSKMENCNFINCKFANCTFQFTEISHCNFRASEFTNNKWDVSPIKKSQFYFCGLDARTAFFTTKDQQNQIHGCHSMENISWIEFPANGEALAQEVPMGCSDPTQTYHLGVLINQLKKIAA